MINELLAIKITRHDFGNTHNVGSTGFFPAKTIIHNGGKLILRQGDVYKLVINNKLMYGFVKFITSKGYYRRPVLVNINDIVLTDDALIEIRGDGFELFNKTKKIEYIGNFIEDDIQTILNIIENYSEKYLYKDLFKSLMTDEQYPTYFYNYFDKSSQEMLFHLSFNNAVFMLKDFEKIILENDKIAQQLDLRRVNFFPIYPFYNLHDGNGNKRPIHTTLNGVLNIQNELYITLLNNEGYIRIYDLTNGEVVPLIKLLNKLRMIVDDYNRIDENKFTFKNTCFSNKCADYIYLIHTLNFDKINKLINK